MRRAMSDSKKPTLAGAWQPFLNGFAGHLAAYHKELSLTWQEVRGQLDAMEPLLAQAGKYDLEPDRLLSLRACFIDPAEKLLFEPVREQRRQAPQRRTLTALTDLRASLEDTVRRVPSAVWVTGGDLAEHVVADSGGGLLHRWVGLSRKLLPMELRRLIEWQVEQDELNRARLDGEFHLLLVQASLHLVGPWHVFRQRSLDLFDDAQEAPAKVERIRRRWLRRKQRLLSNGDELFERYRRWFADAPERMVVTILSSRRKPRPAGGGVEILAEYFDYWSRQQRAVGAVLDLEVALAQLASQVIESGNEILHSLDEEHEALLVELDTVLAWLRRRQEEGNSDEWPTTQAELLSAEARANQFVKEVSGKARTQLPEAIEATNPKGALPGWRKPWRRLEPAGIFLRVLDGATLSATTEGLREAEAVHRSVVRELERSREVVAYGEEAAKDEEADGQQIAGEGINNAISLLEYHRSHTIDVRPAAERGLTRGLAQGFLNCYIELDQGRLGLLTHLLQEASERGLRRVAALALDKSRRATLTGIRQGRTLWRRLLVSLGLSAQSTPPSSSVFRAERLEQLLEFRLIRPDLPLIYRRLFRLAPVEDTRFLVGREDEMAGLVEARVEWLSGKAVSVLVVGARGSGKTSLLNCGARIAFGGLSLTRAQFDERITSPEGMEGFLRRILDIPGEQDIAEALAGSGRVIVLEEVERSFLRRMNGFAGLRFLLDLVASTWHDVLWVLALNEAAHQYLDRAVNFDHYFTHRLNAMTVRVEDIREAILMRHNLSGYRLAFPPLPETDPRLGRLRRVLGLESAAEELFFEVLYRQAEGIFRTAFEIWEHHIERIEGGVVHLRQPVEPDLGPLRDSLSHLDCFTLQALLQHGGLMGTSLAEIFGESAQAGQSRIERLLSMEILEPDPSGPGFRIRPEAGRLVREVLHKRNL
jgi:hypothetical protein